MASCCVVIHIFNMIYNTQQLSASLFFSKSIESNLTTKINVFLWILYINNNKSILLILYINNNKFLSSIIYNMSTEREAFFLQQMQFFYLKYGIHEMFIIYKMLILIQTKRITLYRKVYSIKSYDQNIVMQKKFINAKSMTV